MRKLTSALQQIPIYLFLAFISVNSFAQNKELLSYQKDYPEETRVDILDEVSLELNINDEDSLLITERNSRETIYLNKNAGQFAETYVISTYFTPIISVKAQTLVPSKGDKYKTEKIKKFEEKKVISNSIFFDDTKKIFFQFPSLREGAKTKLDYITGISAPQLLPAFYLKDFTCAKKRRYTVAHDKNITMEFKYFNGADSLTTYTKSKKGQMIIHTWEANNVKALNYEPSAPSFQSIAPHIFPIVNSYKNSKDVEVPLLRNIDDLHNWYTELLEKSEIEESEELRKVTQEITKGIDKEEEKVNIIYEWVQKQIKYVAYEDGLGGFVPRPPQLVFQRKFGDCKDMALLITKMLEYAEIPSYVGWVGTRDKPYTYEELPTPGCDNHMIAVYQTKATDWIFLDATGTYNPFGYPSGFIQGKEVLVHKSAKEYEIVKVPAVDALQNLTYDSVVMKIEDGILKGNGYFSTSGFPLMRLKHLTVDTDSINKTKVLKRSLEKGNNKFFFELKSFDLHNPQEGNLTYEFRIEDYMSNTSDEYYLNMGLQKFLSTGKIEKDRENPYKADQKNLITQVVVLELGDNWEISALPKSQKESFEKFSYEIQYTRSENTISYKIDILQNYLSLEKEDFEDWNKMIKKLNRKYKEVVILKKKS